MKIPVSLALLLSLCAAAAAQRNAVAMITATIGHGNVNRGTGFFISDSGEMLSCYHVVLHAQRIEVYVQGHDHVYTDIEVTSIAPAYDLALLKVRNLKGPIDHLSLNEQDELPPRWSGKSVEVFGYNRTLNQIQKDVVGRITADSYVKSGRFFTAPSLPSNVPVQRVFGKSDVDIIPLDISVYSGLSGAPVVYQGSVIGVLSGSLQEGGGDSWAIPVKYLKKMEEPIRRDPSQMKWEPLELMTAAWVARSSREIGSGLDDALYDYTEALNKVRADLELVFSDENLQALTRVGSVAHERRLELGDKARMDQETAADITIAFQGSSFEDTDALQHVLDDGNHEGHKVDFAFDRLKRELKDYFQKIPRTPRNQDLEKATFDEVHSLEREMKVLEKEVNQMNSRLGKGTWNTLGEMDRGITKLIDLWGQAQVYLRSGMEIADNVRQIVENVFEAGAEPKGPA